MNGLNDFRKRFGIVSQVEANPESTETAPSTNSSRRNSKASSKSDTVFQYRLGAYVRLSPSDEIRDEGSLVSHPQRIQSFVDFRNKQTHGWGKIVDWYTDKDMSGKDMNRPAFRRMLMDIQKGRINAVIVTELSRLSRNVKDFCQFWEFLKDHKATFLSLKENFDTSTPIGEMMVIQCISFAQFERKTIVTRIKDGARARAERGLASCNQRLLGYDLDEFKKCHLVVNETEAETVRHMFAKFIELGSVRKLMAYLNEGGFRTKRYTTKTGQLKGGHVWTPSSLHNTLSNLAYIAKREINKKNRTTPVQELVEADRYKVVDAAWPRIVSDEVFAEAQRILVANHNFTKGTHIYRLTGLLHCGKCGQILSGKAATGRNGKFRYYAHNRKFRTFGTAHSERCPLERIPSVQLEEAVIGRLLRLAGDKALLLELAQKAQVKTVRSKEETARLIAEREQERRNIQTQIDNLLRVLSQNPENQPKSVLGKVTEYELQLEQLSQTIEALREQKERDLGNVVDMQHVFRLFAQFQKGFSDLPSHRQRNILRKVVRRIEVHEDGTRLLYYCTSHQEELINEISGIGRNTLSGLSEGNVGEPTGSHPDCGSPDVQSYGGGGNRTLV